MDCLAHAIFLTNGYCVQKFIHSKSTVLSLASLQAVKMEVVSTSVGKFTVDLFNKLNETNKGKNIFFSPWSISAALALTYLGAKGTTATEMAEVVACVHGKSHLDLHKHIPIVVRKSCGR